MDFSILFEEAAPRLFETWVPLFADKLIYVAKREKKLPVPEELITQGKSYCYEKINKIK